MSYEELLWGAVLAGPLFIITFIIESALRRGYSPMKMPVSALSLGPRGWVQQANFFVNGALLFVSAFGVPAAADFYGGSFFAPLLIGTYGAGLIVAGVFVTDFGVSHDKRTKRGLLHDASSVVVFGSLAAAAFVFANLFAIGGDGNWEAYSIVTGVLYICGFLLFARGFGTRGKLSNYAGLLQRLTISLGAVWLSLVALHLLGIL
jgi:hypothetical protein